MRFTDISCYDLMMMNMTWPPGRGDDDDDWQVPTRAVESKSLEV